MSSIVGDVLLSSALLAYAGYYDQAMRAWLHNAWLQLLERAGITCKSELARIEYLSTADERLGWHTAALPSDELCIENAIMLKRFNRYPLVIDPSGQATEFLANMHKEPRKLVKTSFLDNSFRKNLESALRFGHAILIQDVENYDPILNPILNREIRRTGGRVLITLGDQDIDFSPAFSMYLSTRDPSVEFAASLCSRVTFVNFTITRASLQAQCLHQVLRSERPDTEQRRVDLLRVQGEFQQRLRHLEKDLLAALNETKDSKILNDDTVIARLETLKREAHDIGRKVRDTEEVMRDVDAVIAQYSALSHACSSIYFTMEQLGQMHTLYQYSLSYFMEMFNTVLSASNNEHLAGVKDPQARLGIITRDLFYMVYARVGRGMLHDDRIVLALLLAKLYVRGLNEPSVDALFRLLMSGTSASAVPVVNKHESLAALTRAGSPPPLVEMATAIRAARPQLFDEWLESTNPELHTPASWLTAPGGHTTSVGTSNARYKSYLKMSHLNE